MSFKVFAFLAVAIIAIAIAAPSGASLLSSILEKSISLAFSRGNMGETCKLCAGKTIGSDIVSTLCIVADICRDHSDARAKGFADCYDQNNGLGKDQFFECMRGAFDNKTLTNSENLDYACKNFLKLGSYASCLKPAFEKAGVNQDEAVTAVNKCQANALGVGKKA